MIEPITTVAATQQSVTAHAENSQVNPMKVHEVKQSSSQSKDSKGKQSARLTEFELLLQKSLADSNQSVHISMDELTKRVVVKFVDNATNEVVRQLPTEEMLEITRSLVESEMKRGNITDARV